MKRTLSRKLQYAILENIAAMSDRHLKTTIGDWLNRVRERVDEPFDYTDLVFAFKCLFEEHQVYLTALDGTEYSGNRKDDSRLFYGQGFSVEVTPTGWSNWESIKR